MVIFLKESTHLGQRGKDNTYLSSTTGKSLPPGAIRLWGLQHPHLLNSGLCLGATYPEAPKPGPPKQFPWLSLSRSCRYRHWPASRALNRKGQLKLAHGRLLTASYSPWSQPDNILSGCLCWIFRLRAFIKLSPQYIANTAFHSRLSLLPYT